MRRFLPVLSITIAAFFAYSTVLAKDVTERSLAVRAARLVEVFALLGAFVTVAMIVAALVSTSTFRIVFAQRMRELALLRAVGASRARLARGLITEGALTGLLASVAGGALAAGAGQLVPLAGLVAPGFPLAPALVVVSGSFVLTTLAVLAPAWSAAKVSPLEALRTSAVQDTKSRIGRPRWVLGILMAVGAVALLVHVAIDGLATAQRPSGMTEDLLLRTTISGALAFGALITLGPALISPVLRLIGLPLRRSTIASLAVSGVGGAPRRAASVTAVVALGVSLIIATLTGANTLQGLGKAEMASAYPADLEIVGPVDAGTLRAAGLTDVLPYRRTEITINGTLTMRATDLDMTKLRDLTDFRADSGALRDMGPRKIILSTSTASRLGLTAGSRAEVNGVRMTVAATLFGGVPLGSALLHSSDVEGAPAGVLANGARERVPAGLEVESLAAHRLAQENWFASLVAIAVGLLFLTVLIAVVGVGSTTALSVLERTRESGLLRAIGLTRKELGRMVTAEAGLYGVVGAVIGLVIGIPYAWLAIISLGIEWPLQVPVVSVGVVVLALAALTAGAGLLPARRAARVSPVAALHSIQ
ncbi:putative ABC transport system permease protein [Lentzea albidocapillata subsp. violacea]|uniref:Putative ABC transport system permease protein n=1 Tax=Lentzea albidocapillata subsp. violacea TaxID=128104 RepID=A0A1G9SGU1_9PSEU|nr:ABC transporter permease [Lentzea albidocapillata]SDM34683.1 putative ABC transport system permease protein [Lentzea albidocapillata subsp. violacea]